MPSSVVMEETPESLLDGEDIKPVNLTGNQPGIFSGRTAAKIEPPMLWPPDAKS